MFYSIKKINTDQSVDVANTSTLVIAENPRRKLLTIVNASDTEMWLRFQSPAIVGRGLFLSGGGFTLEIGQGNLWTGPIYAIHSAGGTKRLSVLELE